MTLLQLGFPDCKETKFFTPPCAPQGQCNPYIAKSSALLRNYSFNGLEGFQGWHTISRLQHLGKGPYSEYDVVSFRIELSPKLHTLYSAIVHNHPSKYYISLDPIK